MPNIINGWGPLYHVAHKVHDLIIGHSLPYANNSIDFIYARYICFVLYSSEFHIYSKCSNITGCNIHIERKTDVLNPVISPSNEGDRIHFVLMAATSSP